MDFSEQVKKFGDIDLVNLLEVKLSHLLSNCSAESAGQVGIIGQIVVLRDAKINVCCCNCALQC